MSTVSARLILSTILGIGALLAAVPERGHAAGAMGTAPADSVTLSAEQRALQAIAEAHRAAQRRQSRKALDEIERAETALLNIAQIDRDPHVDAALERLLAARSAVDRKDFRTVDEQLAAAAHGLAASVAAASGAPPIGAAVYNANDEKLGNVVAVMPDPATDAMVVVIGVGDYLGTDAKNVAVPQREIASQNGHLTVDRSKRQLQAAQNVRVPDDTARSGSSTPQRRPVGMKPQ